MDGRWLFFLPVLAAVGLAPAQTTSLHGFESLSPGDIPAEQTAITNLLSQTNDPAILLGAARIVQTKYLDGPVNTLEYWGPDAQTQEQLRPAADAALHLIENAETSARQLAERAAGAMHNANDPSTLAQWKTATAQVAAAQAQELNTLYARLLAAEPEEKQAWENRAFSAMKSSSLPHSPTTKEHLQSAKILLAGGAAVEAKSELAKLTGDSSGDIAEQFQEHFFYVVCDLVAGDLAKADADLSDLKNWQNRTLVRANAIYASPAAVATAILEYRVDLARADNADGHAQKISFETSAIASLQNLVRAQPSLKTAVLEHLAERFTGRADRSHTEPLVLEAIMRAGMAADASAQTLASAQWAAQMVMQRSGEFDQATLDFAAALSAAIFDRDGQTRAAADAYLALARRLENRNLKTASAALDRAIELFRQMPDQAGDASYAQALALAMQKPFARDNLGYAYGQTLVEQQNYRAALTVFQQIPPGDPHYEDAELSQMVCINRLMHGQSTPARLASATQIASLETEILHHTAGPSMSAVSAIFICADVDQTLHEPQMTLEQLRALPGRCRGLAQEPEFLSRADELRVAALVQLDRPMEAVNILAAHSERINVPVADLIKELDTAFDAAKNPAARRNFAEAHVRLGGWLVKYAGGHNGADLNRNRLFYADSLRRAAELEKDEATRQADLHKALDIFQQLATASSGNAADPTPLLGLAGAQFDLGNYPAVHDTLFPLLNSGRFGDGQGPTADQYWEATYELLAGNAALADSGRASSEQRADNVAYLKRLFIQWGDQIGGKRWHAAFESLRRRIAPGFVAGTASPPG